MSSSNIGSTSRSTYDSVMSGLGKIGSAIYHAPRVLGKLFGVTVKPVTGIRNLMGKMVGMFFSYNDKDPADIPLDQADIPLDTTFSSLSLLPTIPTSAEITAAKQSLVKEGKSPPTDQEIYNIPTSEEIQAAKQSLVEEGKSPPTDQEIYQEIYNQKIYKYDQEIYKKIIEARINTLTDYRKLLRKINKSLNQSDQDTLDNLEKILKSLQNNNSRESENVTNTTSTSEQPVNQSNDQQEIEEETKKLSGKIISHFRQMPTKEERINAQNEL